MAPYESNSIVKAIQTLNVIQSSNMPISSYERVYSIWKKDGPYKTRYLVEQLLESLTGVDTKVYVLYHFVGL